LVTGNDYHTSIAALRNENRCPLSRLDTFGLIDRLLFLTLPREVVLEESISYIMSTLLRDMRAYYDIAFRKFDLTRYEWLVLALLNRNEGTINQSAIKEHIGIDTSYLTKVLDKLVEKQFIVRDVDPEDRRNRIVKLSDNPPEAVKEIHQILEKFGYEIVSEGFSEQEYADLVQGLHRVSDNIKKHTELLRQNLLA
jgi:DNA-binding MarR family transcriptional regulator